MSLPTVRVRHPILGAVTINASDFGDQHELHPEQAEGFDPAWIARPAERMDPAERDLAARVGLCVMAQKLGLSDEMWRATPIAERMALMREMLDAPQGEAAEALSVGKGPRGLWYVVRGETRVSKGYGAKAEADAERSRRSGVV